MSEIINHVNQVPSTDDTLSLGTTDKKYKEVHTSQIGYSDSSDLVAYFNCNINEDNPSDSYIEDSVGNMQIDITNECTSASGILGNCLYFNATNFISTTNYSGIPVGNFERTFCFWIKTAYTSTEYVAVCGIVGAGGDAVGDWLLACWENRAISLIMGGHRVSTPSAQLQATTWYHVAIVVPSGAATTAHVQIWINGIQQTLTSVGGSGYPHTLNTSSNTYFSIGGGSTLNKLTGYLDEIQFYDRALTADELLQIYKKGKMDSEVELTKLYVKESISAPTALIDSLIVRSHNITTTGYTGTVYIRDNDLVMHYFNFVNGVCTYYSNS